MENLKFNKEGKVWCSPVTELSVHHGSNNSAIAVHRHEECHVVIAEFEIENVQILVDPGWGDRFGDYDDATLEEETKEDLGCALAHPGGNGNNLGIFKEERFVWLGPRTVR